jgi:transcriptional regulator with XRE-family HTH domain
MDESLGLRIRLARIRRGLSQRQLAALVGLSLNALSAIERNSSNPSTRTLTALATVLQVSTDYLVGLREVP